MAWLQFLLFALLAFLLSLLFGPPRPEKSGGRAPEEIPVRRLSLDDASPPIQRVDLRVPPGRPLGASPGSAPSDVASASRFSASPESGPCLLSGRVLDAQGLPAAGLSLLLLRAEETSAWPGWPSSRVVEALSADSEGRFSILVDAGAGELRLGARSPLATHHVGPPFRPRPWGRLDLGDWRLRQSRVVRVEVGVEGGDPRAFETEILVRPAAAGGLLGPPVLRLDEDLRPPLIRPGGPEMREHLGDRLVLGIDGLGAGSWEVFVIAREHAPRRLLIPADGPETATLRADLALSRLAELRFSERDEDRVWLQAPTADGGAYLVPSDAGGVLRAPRSWLEHPGARLLRSGDPPRTCPGPGRLELPPRGELVISAPPPGSASARVVFAPAVETAEGLARERALRGEEPAAGLARRLAPGLWTPFWSDAEGRGWAGAPIEVVAGDRRELEHPAGPGSLRRLEGRLLDEVGRGLGEALVAIAPATPEQPVPSAAVLARTDAEGRFRLEGLPSGPLELAFGAWGRRWERRLVEVPEAAGAEVPLEVTLSRARGRLEVVVRDEGGDPVERLGLVLVDRHGVSARAATDRGGEARFAPLGSDRYVLLAESGTLAVPLDSWDWLIEGSGGPVLDLLESEPLRHEWTLPRRVRVLLDVRATAPDAAVDEIEIRLVHPDRAVAPGVWPSHDLGTRRPGRLEIDRIFPGSYRAVATWRGRVATAEFEVPAADGAALLELEFPPPR